MKKERGFSIIEMVVVLSIMITLTVVGILSLTGRRSTTELTDTAKQMAALLREAQSNSMAQEGGVAWGVRFSNVTNPSPFYALFKTSYATSNVVTYNRLSPIVAYVTSSVNTNAFVDITFSQISGIASASKTIMVYIPSQKNLAANIAVASSGAIIY